MTTQIEEKRHLGKIIKVSKKGYIFIISQDFEFKRIFGHWTQLIHNTKEFKDLKEGMKVEFSAKNVENKGLQAQRIKVIE